MTKGVGVHPRGGWRSEDGADVEKSRGVAVDDRTDTGKREATRLIRCVNKLERILSLCRQPDCENSKLKNLREDCKAAEELPAIER